MPKIKGEYINPFYRNVDDGVRKELDTRGEFYGRKVRGIGAALPKNVIWSYQKTAWAHVISVEHPSVTLGFPGSKIMSDSDGKLTLYSATRNVPKKPLLTGLEITNEGTMGSLLKGKFSFVVFPVLTGNGFDLGILEKAFFKPGKSVELSWGWSVAANNEKACMMEFTGIIYNFNWTFNNDMSISADVSIVSAASIALGQSGDQSVTSTDPNAPAPKDPKDMALQGNNLVTCIDQDLASLSGSYKLTKGQTKYVKKTDVKNGSGFLDYTGIGLPFQESSEVDNQGNPKTPPVEKTFWYVKLQDVAEFANKLLEQNKEFSDIYKVQVAQNEADLNTSVKSSYPIDVYFPHPDMGSYGDILKPDFGNPPPLTRAVAVGTIDLGEILIGVDHVKKTYKQFIEENSANIPFKNLTNFFETLIKRINESSGDVYQLTVQLFEPRQPSGTINSSPTSLQKLDPTLVSIEDSNLSKVHTDEIKKKAYLFDGRIFKPLIKNVSISSKPPGPMATAAYAQARGGGTAKPNNGDVQLSTLKDKAKEEFEKALKTATDQLSNDLKNVGNTGFNDAWSERVRGNLVKIKKSKLKPEGKNGAHWLNEAIYPIDFSVTIDGIAGFKFGDTITTNLIPKDYREEYDMVFTVTKVSHTIKDGMWETTLNTKARVSMD